MAIADQRNGDSATAPPQNLEAEQSVLGAVLLSDTALPALIIDERLQPEDFYREAHGLIFQAMLDLHTVGEPVDALTLVEHLKQAGLLENVGGRAAVDLLAGSVPAVGNVRQYARIVRENAMLRRLLRASYEIQARVHSHEAPPARARRPRRALDPRGRPRRPPQGLPRDPRPALRGAGQARAALRARHLDHRHPVRLRGPRPHHRRLPARQPDHPRRPPWHGQVGADGQLRRARGAHRQGGGRAVQPRDVRGGARAALHRQPGVDQGRRPAQGQGAADALGEDPRRLQPARGVGALRRRLLRPLGARRAREDAPARPAAGRRPRAGPHRLPPAHARHRADRQPRRAGRPDLARAEDARARARGAGDRALPAQPRRRAARRQAPDAVRPPRVRRRSSRTRTW